MVGWWWALEDIVVGEAEGGVLGFELGWRFVEKAEECEDEAH